MMTIINHKSHGSRSFRTPREGQNLLATGEEGSAFVNSNGDDGVKPDCNYLKQNRRDFSKKTRKRKKQRRKKNIRVGTWNVRTMLETGKLHLLVHELDRSQMNITGLVEVRWKGEGKFNHGDHTIVYSGNDKGGSNGVALLLDKFHAQAIKGYNAVSDRILTLKLNTKHHILNIIQVYAPTSACSDEEIETFYSDLQNVKDKIPRREVCIIMGDLNAKVGEEKDLDSGIGPYGLGVRNERGNMLASFCQSNDLIIANTLFKQHQRRRYTWISPGDRVRNQIDYIMVDKRWKSAVLNSKTLPGTDCDTDHILVMAKINFKALKSSKKQSSPKFNMEKLNDPEIASNFEIAVTNRFTKLQEAWAECEKVPEEIWTEIKTVFTEEAQKHLGQKERKKPKSFISEEVLNLAKKKSDARKAGDKDEYKKLKREVKSKIRRDKKIWLEQECAKITEHNENRKSRELFNQVKSLKQTSFKAKSQSINTTDGKTLTEPQEVLDRWHEYGNALFNVLGRTERDLNIFDFKESNSEKEPEPLLCEVEAAIKELKIRKSPGLDNIPGELLKYSGVGGMKAMHHLVCTIWRKGEWPTDWKTQEFVMLYKSGNIKDCNNYRTIALISHASKILLIILLNRMKQKVEYELSDCQAGYRKNRGTIDMLFILQNIIDKINATDEELFITFIDYSKAFDSVDHQHLFETMCKMGFPKHLVALLASLYKDQRGTIRWDNQNSKFFSITKGVRQGCILSPHLFNVYTEQVMREADTEDLGLNIGGRYISNLRYADDTALLADNLNSMKRVLHRVDMAGRRAGLKLNAKKTKVMHITGERTLPNNDIKIDGVPLEEVDDFKYLGTIKANNGSSTKDIKTRIGMAKNKMIQLNNIWKDHCIPLNLKLKLLKCLVWPVMTYGCESWTQRKDDDKRIEAAEMWFHRRLLRVKWTDKRSNQSVLDELGVSRTLLKIITQRKLRYVGHAIRNSKTDLMKISIQGKIPAKRKKGRPATSLLSNIKQSSGQQLHKFSNSCLDRDGWRQVVHMSAFAAPTSVTRDGDR